MDAGFIFEFSINILAEILHHNIPISAMVILVSVNNLPAPTLTFGISPIHPQKDSREIFGIVATSAREYGQDGFSFVIFAQTGETVLEILNLFDDALGIVLVIPKIWFIDTLFKLSYSGIYFFRFSFHIILVSKIAI